MIKKMILNVKNRENKAQNMLQCYTILQLGMFPGGFGPGQTMTRCETCVDRCDIRQWI